MGAQASALVNVYADGNILKYSFHVHQLILSLFCLLCFDNLPTDTGTNKRGVVNITAPLQLCIVDVDVR